MATPLRLRNRIHAVRRLMTQGKPKTADPRKVERVVRGNLLLLLFAVALGVVDVSCFQAFEARDALPSAARVYAGPPKMSQLVKPAPLAAKPGAPVAPALAPTALQIDHNALASAR